MDAVSELVDRYLAYGTLDPGPFSPHLPAAFWWDLAIFLLILVPIIWPPEPFVRWGLTLENLHPRLLRYDVEFLTYLIMKTSFNRFFLSILPCAFIYIEIEIHDSLPMLKLAKMCTQCLLAVCFKDIALDICLHARGIRRVPKGFIQVELSIIDDFPYSGMQQFAWRGPHSQFIFCNVHFFINERRFGYSLERMAQMTFSVVGTTDSLYDEILSILAVHKESGRSYSFRIPSYTLPPLRNFTAVEWKCKKKEELFVEKFVHSVKLNEPCAVDETEQSPDSCFACHTARPDVIIRKGCNWVAPSFPLFGYAPPPPTCGECTCRPSWCSSCLGRIFAQAQQKQSRALLWLRERANCPFCRRPFCVKDVRPIRRGWFR